MPEMDGYETMQAIRSDPVAAAPADHCADRKSDEGRPGEVPAGGRLGLSGEAGQHGAVAFGASHLAASVGRRTCSAIAIRSTFFSSTISRAKLLSYEVILEELGETLIKASSGRQALEQLLRSEVAVILVDVAMPELDGFELAAMIRDHPRFARTAIIFVSAVHLSEIDSLRGYQAGAVDYLPVPVVPALLRAKVRVFCELYRKTRQLELLNAELEQRVADRTAELEAANAELEKRVEARTREREQALAQVAEMQKLESLGQLTGGLAHDFNNLLMVVMSSIELSRKRVEGDERLTDWLGPGDGGRRKRRGLDQTHAGVRQAAGVEAGNLRSVGGSARHGGNDVALVGSQGAHFGRSAN